MGVFTTGSDALIDYWLEDGLPLTGIDIDGHDPENVSVMILLSNRAGTEKSHYSHIVKGVKVVKLLVSPDGESDGLEIIDEKGDTTVLRFENMSF